MKKINILGQSYESRSVNEDGETCINWYLEGGQEGYSKWPIVLYPTMGLTQFVDLTGTKIRQLLEFDGSCYAICDFKFYKISPEGIAVQKGTLDPVETTFAPCMVSNGVQIGIVDNGNMYNYNIDGGVFAKVTAQNTVNAQPNYLTFQDGYGIYNQPGTNLFWLTGIDDFNSTDDLDFASAVTTNQDITALISNRQQLYIFTGVGCEVWFNTGSNDFPFQRKNTSYATQGTRAPGSVTLIDNTIYYLTSSSQGQNLVVKLEGDSSPVVVSTAAIAYQISLIADTSDAIGFSFQEAGHVFYALIFPSGNKSFAFDLSTKTWHERTSSLTADPGITPEQGRWRANCYCFLAGKHLVGSYNSGKIYRMTDAVYTEDSLPIYRERVTSPFTMDLNRTCIRSVIIDAQMGVGTEANPNPILNLYVSRDGGYTYGSAYAGALGADIGGPGEYLKRIKFNRLGTARSFVAKLTTVAPVNVVLLGAVAEIEERTS